MPRASYTTIPYFDRVYAIPVVISITVSKNGEKNKSNSLSQSLVQLPTGLGRPPKPRNNRSPKHSNRHRNYTMQPDAQNPDIPFTEVIPEAHIRNHANEVLKEGLRVETRQIVREQGKSRAREVFWHHNGHVEARCSNKYAAQGQNDTLIRKDAVEEDRQKCPKSMQNGASQPPIP